MTTHPRNPTTPEALGRVEQVPDAAGEVAFEAADGFGAWFAFDVFAFPAIGD
jgi:hypothetical protein